MCGDQVCYKCLGSNRIANMSIVWALLQNALVLKMYFLLLKSINEFIVLKRWLGLLRKVVVLSFCSYGFHFFFDLTSINYYQTYKKVLAAKSIMPQVNSNNK